MQQNHIIADWDAYAQSFQSVMPSKMLQLNKEVASHVYGNVADFGCGAGKILPFVVNQKSVRSYTGIDLASDMVEKARWMAERFPNKPIKIIENRIEEVTLESVDSAMSINSYYTWLKPASVLAHIYKQIKPGGLFILVTVNPDIDMPGLLQEAEMELVAHPHWEDFKMHNLAIMDSEQANFVDLGTLLSAASESGFRVLEAHQKLYAGGLNFLVLSRV